MKKSPIIQVGCLPDVLDLAELMSIKGGIGGITPVDPICSSSSDATCPGGSNAVSICNSNSTGIAICSGNSPAIVKCSGNSPAVVDKPICSSTSTGIKCDGTSAVSCSVGSRAV